jgi:hypothetical protein
MKIRTLHWVTAAGIAAAAVCTAMPIQAQEEAGTTPVSMTISVEAKHGKEIPPITIENVKVFQGSTPDRVTEITPLQGKDAGLQLYILVDDSAEATLALQFQDIRNFIKAQPPETQMAIGYLEYGTVKEAQGFTTDRDGLAKALRLPLGMNNGGPSPYLSVSDLIKHWPAYSGRREIMMFTEGVDELQEGAVNSYLDAAVEDAQKAGVQVYAVYTANSGHMGHTYWRIYWGQYDLSRMADETGGELYWQGFMTPVSFQPYLQEFADRLTHQYRITFLAHGRKKGGLERVSFETDAKGVQIVGASDVYVPPSQ